MWFDAEEKGLVGSRNWCDNPTVPIDTVAAMFNLDMVGRNDTTKIMVGVQKDDKTPKFAKFHAFLLEAERQFRLKFDWEGADAYVQRSDQWHFMEKGVPAAFFFAGLHADYHTDRDDVEKINFQKEELIGKIVFWLAYRMASGKVDVR
jgi:Zn-dependent M28 family amino/carboxypeptidase